MISSADPGRNAQAGLYTDEQRRRRDATRWTLVQGVLAPLQFLIFLVSLFLVFRYLLTGQGLALTTLSIVVKTLVLYTIMVTGSLWEREVFGKYLFAGPFFWEDVVSILVLALHTAYLAVLLLFPLNTQLQIFTALAAYAAYLVNAIQFLVKFRQARRQASLMGAREDAGAGASGAAPSPQAVG
ncbi:MAG: 2-vinyl bacteriochlorophyllide hydratase [Xanthomonadales bacterium]|nr:2-vinyl bacteriochlorophyllide hydratase [Xanthomonadales bacterium]